MDKPPVKILDAVEVGVWVVLAASEGPVDLALAVVCAMIVLCIFSV